MLYCYNLQNDANPMGGVVKKSPTESEPAVTSTNVQPSTCWECGTLCGSLLTTEKGVVTKISPKSDPSGIERSLRKRHPLRRMRPIRMVGFVRHCAGSGRGEGYFEPVG